MDRYHGIDTPIIVRQIKKAMRYPRVMVKVRYAVGSDTTFLLVKMREYIHLGSRARPLLLEAEKHISPLSETQYYDFVSNTFQGLGPTRAVGISHLPATVSNIEIEIEKIKAAFVKSLNQPPGTTLTARVQYIEAGTPQEKRFNRHRVIASANLRTRTRAVKREIAARRIQRAWKNASSNPHNPMGHRMLMNEFKTLDFNP